MRDSHNHKHLLDLDPTWIMEMMIKLEGDDRLFEDSMHSKSMNYLLYEKLERADIEKLKSSISDTKDSIGKIQQTVAKSPELAKHIDSLAGAIEKAQTFAAGLDLENPQGIAATVGRFFGKGVDTARALQSVLSLQTKAKGVTDSLEKGIPFVLKSLEPFMKDDATKKEKLVDLAGKEGMPSADKLSGGIVKAIKSGQPGWAGKLMGMMKGTFGKDEITGDVTDLDIGKAAGDMLALSYADLEAMSTGLEAAPDVPRTDPAAAEDLASEPPRREEAAESTVDEPPPAPEEEAVEEQEDAQSELEGAIQDAAGSGDPPGVAIMAAVDGWVAGLSDTSQRSLQTKDRVGGLKANLQSAIDGAADTLSQAVGDAVGQWRTEHEETLLKSRRFAKKNFDSLEKLIPQLAQHLLTTTNESGVGLTQGIITRVVYKYLNKKFRERPTLSEVFLPANDLISPTYVENHGEEDNPYPENDMIRYRLMKMAGVS